MTNSKDGHRQRLRDRFLAGEANAQTDEALLELLLTYAIPQKDVRPLARTLLARFGGLAAVLAAETGELCKVAGVKAQTAALIKLAAHLRNKPAPNGRREPSPAGVDTAPSAQPVSLFEAGAPPGPAQTPPRPKERPRRGLFSKSLLKEACEMLPHLPETESTEEVRAFLKGRLRFSAVETRERYAGYITRYIFPEGAADPALRRFARGFAGRQELRDACFYRFCQAEPLMAQVMNDLLLPAIGRGLVERTQLRDYLTNRFPGSKSIKECAQAAVEALADCGLAEVTRDQIKFAYREPLLPALAFVVHSEFPPGMYDLAQLENNPALRALLWNPDRLLPLVYELRNRGWVAKVSEIDSVRQLTIRWTLDELVSVMTQAGEGREGH